MCIDHIFVRNNPRYGYQDVLGEIFCCEVTDHLPNFVSVHSDDKISSNDRPMVRLFDEKNEEVYTEHAVNKFEWIIFQWGRLVSTIHK